MRDFPTDTDDYEAWEDELLQEVCRTVKEVWIAAGKPKNVLLAVDGVVPMAKIRQQRVRRFKSAWLRKDKISWDSNAITPGTQFMDKLTTVLNGMAKEYKSWTVSGVDECGEGEHKILKWLRVVAPEDKNVIVYGLDADLILLTMLTGEKLDYSIVLLREKQEFGTSASQSDVQEYTFLSIDALKKRLGLSGYHHVLNYVGLMSLMGNDFLPHSLTHKLSEDGHECVLRELQRMTKSKEWLVSEDGKASLTVLKGIAGRWATDENERMLAMIMSKQEQARRGLGKKYAEEPLEGLPLEWNVEAALLVSGNVLSEKWRDVYWGWMNPSLGHSYAFTDRQTVCAEYFKGFQWVLDYYTGLPINTSWMFPYWIPPLWSDLSRSVCDEIPAISETSTEPTPQEQLTMVLPLQSWGLIRDPHLRRLPAIAPQMWPLSFSFFSAGRKWLWECEALVPVLTAARVRHLLKSAK